MKITVLSEVKAREGYLSEHGLSFLVEADGQRILFDTGASELFLNNASRLGIGLESVQTVVLSHGHYDHGDGLPFLDRKKLVCHPGCFVNRYRRRGTGNLGLALSRDELEKRFDLQTTREPVQLTDHLIFLGEVPRNNDFEARTTPYRLEDGEDDFIMDDSGLAYLGDHGLVVISGCAHAGICNMVDHAVKVTGMDRIEGVIGGFHLKEMDQKTRRTIDYLRNRKVNRVLPSHCTKSPALEGFHRAFGIKEVLAGEVYSF
jgi:7,8-dihydropterin-6-yl-methyl-4-(beta-D-ribofuranosyl)aminobenzene 5'-phosphate synthase